MFLGLFACQEDVEREFGVTLDKSIEILIAEYEYEDYSGSASVLFRQDGKLYEVNASHCSCYGLEDQWRPEETTVAVLTYILDHGTKYTQYAMELRSILDAIGV